jgi:valyl-tRNA synthetase
MSTRQSYDPLIVESHWIHEWQQHPPSSHKETSALPLSLQPQPFIMLLPPPNVTGSLHIGHALTLAIEDALARYHRMCGRQLIWIPGIDHAGIATQQVVEMHLAKTGLPDRRTLGRDKFLEEMWKWKQTYADRITNQLRRLGPSLEWSREFFTLDETRARAVTEAFCRLYDKGLIYRDQRIINWCCQLQTVVSDIEVETSDLTQPTMIRGVEFGVIHDLAYPLESGGEIVISTTRPETILADVAIAVHPEDPRYCRLIGQYAIHPLTQQRLPIIADAILVKPDLGTGAVKVTPGHDANDYACGKRHQLPIIQTWTDDGHLSLDPFRGLDRFQARRKILQWLQEKNYYRGKRPHPSKVHRCSRSGDIIEPMLKPQWFIRCDDMAARALDAVLAGHLQIHPPSYVETWKWWLSQSQDWCISRQLWWGHRIPAYRISQADLLHDTQTQSTEPPGWIVARSLEEAQAQARAKYDHPVTLEQDPDVLDTWFSSALLPMSASGWPNPEFRQAYPISVLETGADILFFWAARMVMLGLELTGELPFKQVYFHPLVRDAHGRKMSKSLGNVIDPMDVIHGITREQMEAKLLQGNLPAQEIDKATKGIRKDYPQGISQCGSDALRFGLCDYTRQPDGINMNANKIKVFRQFANKLWNAIKFFQLYQPAHWNPPLSEPGNHTGRTVMERWIVNRLNMTIQQCHNAFHNYRLFEATEALYRFWWEDICDIFIERSKAAFQTPAADSVHRTLFTVLDVGLRLLHPFMPCVTEELWHQLWHELNPGASASFIIETSYPKAETPLDPDLAMEMIIVRDILRDLRRLKTETGSKQVVFHVPAETVDLAHRYHEILRILARLDHLTIETLQTLPTM